MLTSPDSLQITTLSEREILITRSFNASRDLVYEAITRPELIKRWLGVRAGWTMPVCEMDLRPGGAYRWVWRQESDGTEMGVSGVFREVDPPRRIVHTERFDEAWYPGEGQVTIELVEAGGSTTLRMTLLYESREARDAVLSSPMDEGLAEGYDQLAELLASLA
jgi:uncharacterized protein YndB with AHSA1/START domain